MVDQNKSYMTNGKLTSVSTEKCDSENMVNTIYRAVLADLAVPSSENSADRLEEDALFLMMASTYAPSQALSITMFRILNNPSA
jgi:hypothetical protein